MKLDMFFPPFVPPSQVADYAKAAEKMGFDGVWTAETQHDPFITSALIAANTENIKIGTGIAVSFARSPNTIAHQAWDLSELSGGRFILGLGTQVKAHIEKRFGMEWPEKPIKKFREQINAVRAIWDSWETGERIRFRGEYYKLTLSSPFFTPARIEHPNIPIYIAGVNTGMARLAGGAADGFQVHPFHTPKYLSEVLIPAIEQGAEKAGRKPEDIKLVVNAFAAIDQTDREMSRQQIAFYASTPSYRKVMALHGWEETAVQLSALASKQEWFAMSPLISDEMLETFAVVQPLEKLADALIERYEGIADHLTVYIPYQPDERNDFWTELRRKIN